MMIMLRRFLGLMLLTALAGCATTGGNPHDPLEGYNRAMFGFNQGVDNAIIKPMATGYKKVVPAIARTGVSNFFSNLRDIWIGVNNILQGKVGAGASDFGRFAINTTVGILGLFDIASNAGLEKHNEDFGQTLGRWGVGSGAYVVLPILGPSTVRDGLSLFLVDWHGDPLWYVRDVPVRYELMGLRLVDTRANLLDVSRLAEEASLDTYAYVRDAYLQRRRSLIYDGNPPAETEPAKTDSAPEPEPAKTNPPPETEPDKTSPAPEPDKKSDSGDGEHASARAGAELPPAQITTQWGEPIITAADEELTPAKEFSEANAQPVAALPEATGVTGSVYEPKIPFNYEALLAVSGAERTGLAPTNQRP
jgi:phospholipid-binding lipoprotein MlaA